MESRQAQFWRKKVFFKVLLIGFCCVAPPFAALLVLRIEKDLDFVFCKLLQNVRRILHLSRAKKYCWFGDCKKFLAISPSFSCRCQINESYDFEKSIFSSSRTNVLVLRDLILCLLFYVVPKNRSHTLVCQFISGLHANFLALFWYQTDVKFTLKNSIWSMILQFTVTFGCLRWFFLHSQIWQK